jgi:O-antigen ligase
LSRTARVIVYSLVVWAPIPLGSNRPVLWVVNGLLASLALVLFALGELRSERSGLDWRFALLPAAALTAWSLWMILQIVPGMPSVLAHPFLSETSAIVPGIGATISGSTSATWATLAEAVPIAFLSLVAMRLAANRQRGLFLLKLIAATSVAVALYGLAARYFGFRQVFILDDGVDANFLTGTFAGRSSAASYFIIGIAASAALLATQIHDQLAPAGRGRGKLAMLVGVAETGGIYVLAMLVLAAGLLNTGSRGGVLAAVVVLAAVASLTLRGIEASRRTFAGVLILVLAAVLAVAAVSSDAMSRRLAAGVDAGDRPLVFKDTISMALDRPFVGHGAGTFGDLFPLYHNAAPSFAVWYRAHNPYLQAIAELGLPVVILLLATIAAVLFIIIRQMRGPVVSAVSIGALAAAAGVGFHSLVDFSVQIQAIGLTMAVLLGAGFGDALRLRQDEARRAREARAAPQIPLETVYVTFPTPAEA